MTYDLKGERKYDVSDRSCIYKMRAGTTYGLVEVEREGDVSDRGCDNNTRTR